MSFDKQIKHIVGQEVVAKEGVVGTALPEDDDLRCNSTTEECGDSSGTSVCGYDADYDNEDNETVCYSDKHYSSRRTTTCPQLTTNSKLKFDFSIDKNNNNINNKNKSLKKWIFVGSHVLSRWTDGLFYLGLIVQIDSILEKCLIKFEDSSLYWIRFEDIHKQLTVGTVMADSDILCAICRDGTSLAPNEIVICDVCNQGYHQKCHKPRIGDEILEPDIPWTCRLCVFALGTKEGGAEKNGVIGNALKHMKTELAYSLNDLEWDDMHQTNRQNKYCYCGGTGNYYSKMLQCSICLQWFHEACIQALETPLLYGDHYYTFMCSVCNKGKECLKRIIMKWSDMLALVINNLALQHQKQFFELSADIVTFVQNNSKLLKMSEDITKLTERELQTRILAVLQTNQTKFTNGREFRKKASLWALRMPFPFERPLMFAPPFALQSSTPTLSPGSSPPFPSANNQMPSEPPKVTSLVYGACRKGASKWPALKTFNQNIDNKRVEKNGKRSNSCSSSTGSNSCNASTVSFSSRCSQSTSQTSKTSTKCKTTRIAKPKVSPKRQKKSVKRVIVSKFTPNSELNSDSSDTEVISTPTIESLDAVIPVPKNFEGSNNPFVCDTEHNVLRNRLSNSPISPSHRPSPQTKGISCKVEPNEGNGDNNPKQVSPKMECFLDSTPNTQQRNDKFNILAQRVKPNGKVEYLLEWSNN